MPRRCVAFGNNVCGNLDPGNTSPILNEPVEVTKAVECDEIIWHGWSCTVGRDSRNGTVRIWGMDPLVKRSDRISELTLSAPVKKLLGFDRPIGFLTQDGHVHSMEGGESGDRWDDVVVTGMGATYAFRKGRALVIFESFEALIADVNPIRLSHPLLDPSLPTSIYAAESRVFVHIQGNAEHVLEVLTDHRAGGVSQTPTLQLIEDLEGLGIQTIVPGSSNRLAVITSAGDAYLFSRGAKRPELLKLEDDSEAIVRIVALGSEFEVLVTDDAVWVRGENGFGQLGLAEQSSAETFTRHHNFRGKASVGQIIQVVSARWSTLVVVDM